MPKIFDPPVTLQIVPFITVAMLKEAPSLEIVLTHRPLKRVNGCWDEIVGRAQFSKGQMECLFVSMNIPVIKIAILVKPGGEAERFPAARFIHDDLARLELLFLRSP